MSAEVELLVTALAAVVGLVVLIARVKLHPFIAILGAAVFVGVTSGMDLRAIGVAVQEGIGAILGSVAPIVGLGMVLGKMLEVSGGARVVSSTVIRVFGQTRLPLAMLVIALIVGVSVFFTVGVVLLVPLVFAVARETGLPLLRLGLPILAGLSVMHGLVPPHPGPVVAIDVFKADVGLTIVYALIVGLPAAIVAGPLFGAIVAPRIRPQARPALATSAVPDVGSPPGFGLTVFTIVLPVSLMLAASIADLALPVTDRVRQIADFLGHPILALGLGVLVSYYTFGRARGFSRQALLGFTNDCLAPAAAILLVVGAGGGFNRVLVTSGVGAAIASIASTAPVSILGLGWLVAAAIRLATGSATVAITTAAGIVAPLAASQPVNRELLVVAMGAGSLIASHVNDGGFWFVKEYYGLTVSETLRTWTVLETIIALVGLVGVLLLDILV